MKRRSHNASGRTARYRAALTSQSTTQATSWPHLAPFRLSATAGLFVHRGRPIALSPGSGTAICEPSRVNRACRRLSAGSDLAGDSDKPDGNYGADFAPPQNGYRDVLERLRDIPANRGKDVLDRGGFTAQVKNSPPPDDFLKQVGRERRLGLAGTSAATRKPKPKCRT